MTRIYSLRLTCSGLHCRKNQADLNIQIRLHIRSNEMDKFLQKKRVLTLINYDGLAFPYFLAKVLKILMKNFCAFLQNTDVAAS